MGTVHPRIQVTPNDELIAALDRAAARWPGASRSELVLRLALAGDRSALEEHARRASDRATALARLREVAGGLYDPDEIRKVREEWRA